MRAIALTLAVLCLAMPLQSPAQMPAEIGGDDWSGAAQRLASVQRAVQLVERKKTIQVEWDGELFSAESDLRVSLLVLDLGPATDVSPRLEAHLAMFNDISEFAVAWSLTPIADLWTFEGVRRLEAGIYVIDGQVLDAVQEGCFIHHAEIRIDARKHSSVVRRALGLQFGDSQRIRHPVGVETRLLGCAH